MPVTVTQHADDRIKERLGLPRSARTRAAQRAFDHGRTHADTRGGLKKFLDKCWFEYRTADNVRVHAEHIWFFAGETLITVYAVPRELR